MKHRALLVGIALGLLVGAAQIIGAQSDSTMIVPRAEIAFSSDGSTLIQPETKEERDERLREIQVQNRASAIQEVRTIAQEMALDAPTEQKLVEISITGFPDFFESGAASVSPQDHGLAVARLIANRYDEKLGAIRKLLGEGGLRRYQWCVSHLTQLQVLAESEQRLAPSDRLTSEQRSKIIRLLKRLDDEAMEDVDEFISTPAAGSATFQLDPTRSSARRARAMHEASSFLSPTQVQVLFSEDDNHPSLQWATDPSQIPADTMFTLPTEPADARPFSALEIAVQLDDREAIVVTEQPASKSPIDVELPGNHLARLRIIAGGSSGPQANGTLYVRTAGELQRLRNLGTFGSLSGDVSIMIQVFAGTDRAHILAVSLRPAR